MPLSLHSLIVGVSVVRLGMGEEVLEVRYLPSKLTYMLRLQVARGVVAFAPKAALAKGDYGDAWKDYCAALAAVIVSWDMVDEKGEPYPPTAENIAALPFDAVVAIWDGVSSNSLGNPRIKATSASGSPSTAS